ncbi:MAG: exonuclease domain-containing protein [Pseudomonadota bacterium]
MDRPLNSAGGGGRGIARWSLRLRIFLFFALIAGGAVLSVAAAAYLGHQRLDAATPASAFVFSALIACFAVVALTTWVWFLFDENVAKPLVALAGDLRSRAHADVNETIDAAQARYLGDLAPAAAAVSAHLADSRIGLDAAVERERERVLAEHARLDAILRDTPAGCLLCSRGHRIALYNKAALDHLGALELGFGLGRSLLDFLRDEPILDALARLGRRDDASATDLLCTTKDGAHMFQAKMRLFGAGEDGGYLLTFRDVTRELSGHGRREGLLRDVFDRLQRPAANLLTTIEALRTPQGAEPDARAALQKAVVAETRALAQSVGELRARYALGAEGLWPMAETPVGDILTSIQARLASRDTHALVETAPLTARCDGFAIASLLGDLALEITALGGVDALCLRGVDDEAGGLLELSWRGPACPVALLERRLAAPISPDYGGLTARDALQSHQTDIWPESLARERERLCLPLPGASRRAPPPRAARSVFHDLRLLADAEGGAERELRSLDYVVFDTETTGLHPDRGDEIVQIAAVRIVRGRLLTDELFDLLVDPERRIPAASTEIHGIDEAMVAGAPRIDEAGRRFHAFCGDSVLIAHNAPFDLAFLRRHAERIGASFDHPVLDTALMSAILFGRGADHSLDAIAERLGARIDEEKRHTALGDAVATAEVASRMIAMLEAAGVRTLGEYRQAAEPHREMLGF